MNKILEQTTTSVLVYPTSSTAISGSAGVDMRFYRNAVVKAMLHKLPDQKGDPAAVVLKVYENAVSGATGTLIGAATVTGSLTSISDVYLETEVDVDQMLVNATSRYLNAYVTSGTSTALSVIIDRCNPRHEPV